MSLRRPPHGSKKRRRSSDRGIMEQFSPVTFGKIVPTSTKKKVDAFGTLRPHTGECLEYDISQTLLKMDAGNTKIHVKDIEATYVPAPPVEPKKREKLKIDSPPPYKFINEIWMEKQTELHTKYRKELRQKIRMDEKRKAVIAQTMHNLILDMVGPEWFQELSPNQIRTVDQVQCCIHKDVQSNTITNVQDNIGKLGLTPRPNHRHVAKALNLCNRDPVQFLLILYQLINPKRTEYSLNDRILLSAVVHLCMTNTLRELHVRIPSPPAREEEKVEKQKKEKPKKEKIKYDSPYLEPLVYNPTPPKHTGVYRNPHRQYPESPYFAYLEHLYIERLIADDVFELNLVGFEPDEVELLEDMRQAQLLYDEIRNGDRVKLIRPTVFKQSEHVLKFYRSLYWEEPKPVVMPPLATIVDSDQEDCSCTQMVEEDSSESCCEHEIGGCECQGECNCKKKSEKMTRCRGCLVRERKQHLQRVIKGMAVTANNEVVPIIETTLLHKTCDCMQIYKNSILAVKARRYLQCQRSKYVISGVTMTSHGPVYVISTAVKRSRKKVVMPKNFAAECSVGNNFKPITYSRKESARVGENEKDVTDCICKPEKDERSTSTDDIEKGCTCRNNVGNTKEETTTPCDCTDCQCKELSRMYTGPKCKSCQGKERQKYLERIITGMKETASNNVIPIIEGTRFLPSCNCLQNYVEKILSMEARKRIQSKNAEYVIGGVVMTKMGPVYILSATLLNRRDSTCCCVVERKKSRINEKKSAPPPREESDEEEEDLRYGGCKCKQELERYLKHICTCEKCNVKRRQSEATYVIGGISTCDLGTVKLIQSVYGQTCDCLERYKERMEKLEDYRKRVEARYNLRSQTLKYSIGGVVNTAKGPVYVITGLRPPVDCECARTLRRDEEEKAFIKQMAKMPYTARVKYQISGVKHTPDGNVFVISQALPIEECECSHLYDTYIQAHKACLDAYEAFLLQINEELKAYLADVGVDEDKDNDKSQPQQEVASTVTTQCTENASVPGTVQISVARSNNSFSHYNLFKNGEVVRTVKQAPICAGEKLKICNRSGLSFSEYSINSSCVCDENDSLEDEDALSEFSGVSQIIPNFRPDDFNRNNPPSPSEEKKPAEENKPKLKRFVILKEIPSDPNQQMEILQKVLETMAHDGFPLAKLPDCHKLPHFKLWLHMRCHTFWRQADINACEDFIKWLWGHIELCPIRYKSLSLGITLEEARKYSWRHANFVRKLVKGKKEVFYRHVSQNAVDRAREFFPLTYSYRFPNKTFRDVFFAYMPSKEKDTMVYRIVKPHDTRIFHKI